MKLTKYGHACVFVEKNDSRLVIDPGSLTELPDDLSNIVAIICTHMHGDHTDVSNIQRILEQSPDAIVIAHPESLKVLFEIICNKVEIIEDKTLTIGPFKLALSVVDHAVIWQSSPCKNLTITVDEFYYYPGDSLVLIDKKVEIVGVPLSAPWLKTAEAIEFARSINARYTMPTHNGLFNEFGHEFNQNWLKIGLENRQTELVILNNGEVFES